MKEFIDSIIHTDVISIYERFKKYITQQFRGHDLGCGSGKDSQYFSKKGYEIVAVDLLK